jgi:hypothetical protein
LETINFIEGKKLTLTEVGQALSTMMGDMRKDVLELYDAER